MLHLTWASTKVDTHPESARGNQSHRRCAAAIDRSRSRSRSRDSRSPQREERQASRSPERDDREGRSPSPGYSDDSFPVQDGPSPGGAAVPVPGGDDDASLVAVGTEEEKAAIGAAAHDIDSIYG